MVIIVPKYNENKFNEHTFKEWNMYKPHIGSLSESEGNIRETPNSKIREKATAMHKTADNIVITSQIHLGLSESSP